MLLKDLLKLSDPEQFKEKLLQSTEDREKNKGRYLAALDYSNVILWNAGKPNGYDKLKAVLMDQDLEGTDILGQFIQETDTKREEVLLERIRYGTELRHKLIDRINAENNG